MKTRSTTRPSIARQDKATLAQKRPQDEEPNAGRRRQIMTEAARLFAARGFDATKIRDIAAAAGILGGSIYYYFASKEEIFLAVYSAGMETISSAVKTAIDGISDPWDRLEAAAVAHCEALLATHELPVLVSPYFSESILGLRGVLIAQRDRYDRLIDSIIDDLDLPASVDRKIFRLHFLGALNWMPTWYRPGSRYKPSEIARQLVAMIRSEHGLRAARRAKASA